MTPEPTPLLFDVNPTAHTHTHTHSLTHTHAHTHTHTHTINHTAHTLCVQKSYKQVVMKL